eukprot:5122285-Pyramimonas_sp.AAC.1
MVSVPQAVFWNDSGLSGRSSYDRQDAALMLIRGVQVQRMVFWHASGSPNGCLPTGHFPQ